MQNTHAGKTVAVAQFFTTAWYGGARWLWLLRPLECMFRCAVSLRQQLYRRGILSSYRSPRPVVVVGNITLGGSGKTPVVIALVEALAQRGVKSGVVSRGYGGQAQTYPYTVGPNSTAQLCGDEAMLTYQRTGCPCVVAPDRSAAVRELLASFDVDIIISDDGLQHYALQRDIEIALVDAQRGNGNGFCLPAGPLREPVSRLREVDFVLSRGGSGDTATQYEQDCLQHIGSERWHPATPAAIGSAVHAVAGIGQPGQFFDMLRSQGFDVEEHVFPDHHPFLASDLAALQDKPIIMTEKDAVKCRNCAGDNAWYLKISARLPDAVIAAVAALAHN